jgi:hypothetical protein
MILQKTKKQVKLDHLGIGVSLLCAVHCALLPIIITLLPLAGLKMLNNIFVEIAIIGSSLILACLSLGKSYKIHHNKSPLVMVFFGFLSIALGHFLIKNGLEWIFLTLGGVIIATAHWRNWKLNKSCLACL